MTINPSQAKIDPETATLEDCERALSRIGSMPRIRRLFLDENSRPHVVFETIGMTGESLEVFQQKQSLLKFRKLGESDKRNDIAEFQSVSELAKAINVMVLAERSQSSGISA